jgi:catechol 2,3-dioxygenase-like lactoylglutathione lyase family enzyme
MKQELALVALVVRDYDEAIDFYTTVLKFSLIEDTSMSETKRWVVVAPPGSQGCRILLAKAGTEAQVATVGNQTGGRVFLFYGTVAVFSDLYGNLWDLIEPA